MSLSTPPEIGQRTAVVTGAASPRGIGQATARRYAREGWAVVVLDLDAASAQAAAESIASEFGVPSAGFACDVTSEDSVANAAQTIVDSDLPPVGALANIAGIPSPSAFEELGLDEWNRVIAVNLTGSFLTSKEFVPQMIAGGYGRIVNMSSVTAQHGGGVFSRTAYAAAKAGVIGLTRGLARELAEHGITVNAVAPGVVDTDIRAGSDDENERRLAQAVPLRRQGTPDEMAALFVWLSSHDAGYITGTTQNINGGSYIS
ncbi:SDR family NAD(P)-dependent oxidoreductase [Corynebacterium kalidii]|uniref:SDR family oxidoreductase n=1 Tax=Corynebacterium kalidii TaxID=2931982 RepID=A0A9X2AY67_9CORY|nr:SDR family NAD(P)-dependent oxidoreductase [Corynebacterium kalidii]MCJ7857278.1 SDR family oxidoreductase [Corynebacterium kalidii]